MTRRPWLLGNCLACCLLLPRTAQAHLVNTGFGPFYNGMCHPFVNFTDLMIVLALALLAGMAGPKSGRYALFSLASAWAAGALIGQSWLVTSWSLSLVASATLILLVSIFVTANLQTPRILILLATAVVGSLFGCSNGQEFASLSKGAMALIGVVTSIFMVMTLATALAVKSNYGWKRIVIRVAGSWMAAASLLAIGWELRDRFAG